VFIGGKSSSNVPVRDEDDIRATLAGDGEAFRRIVERHQNEIAQRVRRFARDQGTLEQLVHDTFVEAYFSLDRYRGDAPLVHWLHRIAVRVGYRHLNSQQAARKTLSIEERDVPVESTDADDGELMAVLERLPPRDRAVITLLYLEEHSVEETAKLLGWSKAMVKVQAFRGRAKLRKLMEKDHERN
jgi:RNA polymerase sigma-70 factor (ECF subfamily)